MANALVADLRIQAGAGDTVNANTTLLALLGVLRGAQLTQDQAVNWYDQLSAVLTGQTRCVSVSTTR